MLIVCNGAAKSGSTWLYNVVAGLVDADAPDKAFLTNSKKHPAIRPDRLAEYLALGEFAQRDVLAKSHYGSQALRDLLLSRSDVRVLDMTRSLYDVIVSSYYDARRREGFTGTFRSFYWFEGRSLADYLLKYHRLWGDGHAQVHVASFEGLKENFAHEVRRIGRFLGREPDAATIERLASGTKLETLREKYNDTGSLPFFRKGIIGDWKNHFDDRMLQDIRSIEVQGLDSSDLIELGNRLRRRLHRLIPALAPYRLPQPGKGNGAPSESQR